MSSFIPYGRQAIDDADIAAMETVLRSTWLTQGPAVPAFEQVLYRRCDLRNAIAVSDATSAFRIACLAAGLVPDDRLWTNSNMFVTSADCA